MSAQNSSFLSRDRSSPPNSRASLNHISSSMSTSSTSSQSQEESHTAANSSLLQPSLRPGSAREEKRRKVVAISVPKSDSMEFFQDKFLSGDIVQKIAVSEDYCFTSPFPAGKRGLLEELHNFHEAGVSILTIQVKRGVREITRRALIVPVKKKTYVLHDFEDPSHIFSFDDFTLESCSTLQDHRLKLAQEQLARIRIAAVDVAYPWEENINDSFGMVYSMVVIPHPYADIRMPQSNTLEDTVRQAITWLHRSKASGVPLIFRSIQTEPIITEDSEQRLIVDLSSIGSCDMYSLQQRQGPSDRRVVIRAVRIWFAFHVIELKVELEARQGEGLLGVTIRRTSEGFCHVVEVVPQTAASRAGLKERLDAAKALEMKLVVTKVGNETVLPWFMSNGKIRCFDLTSISSKLSAHRCAGQAVCLHLLDIRHASCPTASLWPDPLLTSPFGVEGNAGTYMEL